MGNDGNLVRYVALLRGINVGGNNIISKEQLRETFESLGFRGVKTYIQSGNILFRSGVGDIAELTAMVEAELSKRFDYKARAVLLSHEQYAANLKSAPADWGNDPDYKHNALFAYATTTPREVHSLLPPPKDGIERVSIADNVLFWSVSKQDQLKTTYNNLPKLTAYKQVTIRNSNTTLRLLKMFDEI